MLIRNIAMAKSVLLLSRTCYERSTNVLRTCYLRTVDCARAVAVVSKLVFFKVWQVPNDNHTKSTIPKSYHRKTHVLNLVKTCPEGILHNTRNISLTIYWKSYCLSFRYLLNKLFSWKSRYYTILFMKEYLQKKVFISNLLHNFRLHWTVNI